MAIENFRLEASGEEKTQTKHADGGGIVASSELLDEFASYTTLHGFHFIFESCSLLRRLVWGALVVTGLVLLIMQCLYGFYKLADHDSVTVKGQQRDEKITFPAVTICNLNMLRKDKILGTEAQKFMDDIESVVFGARLNDDANETFTLDLEDVVREAGHNLSQMLFLCLWHGRLCGAKDFFMFVSLQRGLCYTFNPGKPGYPLLKQSSAGRNAGLLLQLDAQPEQYYGALNLLEGTGFRMLVHDQNEWPDIENHGIDVSPGFSNTVRIRRHKTIRLGPPFKSKCGEKKLASFEIYSHSACFLECWTRAIIDRCHCLTLGMAQLDETKILSYCGPKEFLNCVIPVNGKLLGSLECDCPLKCESIHYEVQLSSSSYPSRHLLPILARRLINESSLVNVTDETWSEIEATVRRNVLQLNVFYQSVITEVMKEKPAYDIYDFGSDIGGNMGLFLGCSILSVFEFVDLFILLCLRKCRRDEISR